jgi:CHAT domain-containing protein/tetratricopeptide (TPR) repeat protein
MLAAVCLSDLGRLSEALAQAHEAVKLRRALAKESSDAIRPALARSLSFLAICLSDLGRRSEALAAAQEAVDLYRALTEQNPKAFRPGLAASLKSLSNRLNALGRRSEALAPAEEMVDLYRALAKENPDAFRPTFADDLGNLANFLSELGRRSEALALAQEALNLHRALAEQNPETFRPGLAASLNNMANRLSDLGRRSEALAQAEEAVDLYRALAKQDPDTFLPALATSLNNIAMFLTKLGRRSEALALAQEAVELRRALAKQDPDAFLLALATSLNNLAYCLRELGRLSEALALAQDAVERCRALAKQNPDAFLPALATSLNNLANYLRELGRLSEALALAQEAVEISERLDCELPLAHMQLRYRALANFGRHLLDSKPPRRQEAFTAFQSAVACAEAFRGSLQAVEDRDRLSGEGPHVHAGLVEAGLALWDDEKDSTALEAALRSSEGSRGRSLLDRLGRVGAQPVGEEALRQWRDLSERLEAAEAGYRQSLRQRRDSPPPAESPGPAETMKFRSAEEPVPKPPRPTASEMQRLLAERQALIRQLQRDPANREFNPDQPVPPANLEVFRAWVDSGRADAVIEYFVSERVTCAFVVQPRQGLRVIRLPGLTAEQLTKQADQWRMGYDPKDSDEVAAWEKDPSLHAESLRRWGEGLPEKLRQMAQVALWPVLKELDWSPSREHPARLLIVPHQQLGFFPLHACLLGENDPRLLAEVCEVEYAPVFSLLPMIARREREVRAAAGLIANPTEDLTYTTLLGLEIEQQRPGLVSCWGRQADETALFGIAAGSRDLFLCGHMTAGNGQDEPALELAHRKPLSITDLYVKLRLPQGRMVVLNGCESGLLMPKAGGGVEYEGLPLPFLFRGAAVVVSTLWNVFDISSALLMRRFLAELPRCGGRPTPALREAARWLREDIRNATDLEREVESLLAELSRQFDPERHPGGSFDALAELARGQVAYFQRQAPDSPPFASPLYWAAHTVSGQGDTCVVD